MKWLKIAIHKFMESKHKTKIKYIHICTVTENYSQNNSQNPEGKTKNVSGIW